MWGCTKDFLSRNTTTQRCAVNWKPRTRGLTTLTWQKLMLGWHTTGNRKMHFPHEREGVTGNSLTYIRTHTYIHVHIHVHVRSTLIT